MKVGDTVYTTHGILRMGTIVEHNTEIGFYVVLFEDNTSQAFASCSVHEHRADARRVCEEYADYWERKARELESITIGIEPISNARFAKKGSR